jgi:hypothetical protein
MVTAIFQRYLGREPTQRPTLDMRQLTQTAEVEGFGYKKANLDQVNELCKQNFGPYMLEVPQYAGIPSTVVQLLLKRHGLDVSARWTQLLQTHYPPGNEELRARVFQSKNFSPAFMEDCEELRQEITDAFREMASGNLEQLFEVAGLAFVIDGVKERQERLMVRSSGKEDTVELANAGGNTSVANVIPSPEEILQAIAQVVSSYFGERSLKQRAGANDPSLFDPVALTPVLIQRMIGERNPTALPKCGVLFTEDCESRSPNAREVRVTSGITVVQAAYGHNEGVVNGLIPVDTYYINEQRTLFPIIRPKTHRMMPTERSGELRLTENDPIKASTTALSLSAIQTLKNFSQTLEQFYGRPMDVEFVIEEPNKIYIVQARPLVHHTDNVTASYLLKPRQLPASHFVKGSTIGAAGGGIRVASSKEVVMASTIGRALDDFQALQNPQEIQVILVGRFAPATSHWATVFRLAGKPVLYTDQLSTVQSWLENPDARLLISPQQGLIVYQRAGAALTVNELQAQGLCAAGWVTYPAAALLSVCPELSSHEPSPNDWTPQICPALRDSQKWAQFQQGVGQLPVQEVFEALPNAQGEKLNMLLAILLFTIQRISENRALDPEQKATLARLQSHAFAYAKSIQQNGHFGPNDPQFGCKLLPIHFLKALFYAQADSDELVDGQSLALTLREIREEEAIASALEKQGIVLKNPLSLSLLRLNQFVIQPEIAQRYRHMIVLLDQSGKDKRLEAFASWFSRLKKLDLLVAWLNLVFPNEPDITQHLKAFRSQQLLLSSLAEKKAALQALKVSAFGDKRSFATQWQVLNQQVLEPAKNNLFAKNYHDADVLGKLATLAFMKQLVDKFDLAIKELEGAPVGTGPGEYTIEEKLKLFQTMLIGYQTLAQQWVNTFDLPAQTKARLIRCLDILENVLLDRVASELDLQFSRNFNVASFGSLSGATLGTQPKTLEDVFSGIHQELLIFLNLLNQEVMGNVLPMPSLMEKVTRTVPLGSRAGVVLNATGMTVFYTKPIRQHGVQYRLHQLAGSEKLTLTMTYSARNELQRWDHIAHLLLFLQIHGKFDVRDISISESGLEATFHLDNNDQLKTVEELFSAIEQYSTRAPDAALMRRRAKPPDSAQFDNPKKQLPVCNDRGRILQAFAAIGSGSLFFNEELREKLQRAVLADDPVAISLFKNAWSHERARNFLTDMSIELAAQGRHLEFIGQMGVRLLDARKWYEGIKLVKAVMEKNSQALPDDCVWKLLIIMASGSAEYFKEIPDILAREGGLAASLQKHLIPAWTSRDEKTRENAEKVMQFLSKNAERWITEGVKTVLRQLASANPAINAWYERIGINLK